MWMMGVFTTQYEREAAAHYFISEEYFVAGFDSVLLEELKDQNWMKNKQKLTTVFHRSLFIGNWRIIIGTPSSTGPRKQVEQPAAAALHTRMKQ